MPWQDYLTTEPSPGSPVYQNLPRVVSAYSNLEDYLAPIDQTGVLTDPTGQAPPLPVDPHVVSSLRTLAQQRVARGQLPPGARMAPRLIRAGQTLQAQTPLPERGTSPLDILGNVAADARDIFTSIPKIPYLLYQQAKQLPEAPGRFAAAIGRGDWQAASQTPGINLIPGVYTLGNILSGDFAEIARHPLFTGLDVAPLASAKVFAPATSARALSRTRPLRLGAQMTSEEIGLAGLAPKVEGRTTVQGLEGVKDYTFGAPKRSALQVIGDETPIGAAKDSLAMRARGTKFGRYIESGLGTQARNLSELASHARSLIIDVMHPHSPIWDATKRGSIYDPSNWAAADRDGLLGLFDFKKKWATKEGITATSGGEFTTIKAWEPRRIELTRMMQRADPDALLASGQIRPWEHQMMTEARALTETIAAPYTIDHALAITNPDAYAFAKVDVDGRTEIYTMKEALKIERARQAQQISEQAHLALTSTDPTDLFNSLAFLRDTKIPVQVRADILAQHIRTLRSNGIDVTPALRTLRATPTSPDIAALIQAELTKPPLYTLADIHAAYRRTYASGRAAPIAPPELRVFDTHMTNGAYRKAWNELNNYFLKTRRASTLPVPLAGMDMDMLRATLRDYDDFAKSATRTRLRDYAADLGKKRKAVVKTIAGTAPARFFPLIKDAANARTVKLARALGEGLRPGTGLADELAEHVRQGVYAHLDPYIREANALGLEKASLVDPLTGDAIFPNAQPGTLLPKSVTTIFDDFAGDAMRSWQDIRSQGFDPVWIHAVDRQRAMAPPRILPKAVTTRQSKARTLALSPETDDLVLGLNHQAMEWLVKKQTDQFIDSMVYGSPTFFTKPFTVSRDELTHHFEAMAKDRAARYGTQYSKELNELIDAQFIPFEPTQYLNFPAPRGSQNTQTLYIDRSLHSVIDQLAEPTKISAVWDPVMGVFRTSVLTLSPRWQVYNILGGALQLTAQQGLGWLKYANQAREYLKWVGNSERSGTIPPAMLDQVSESFRLGLSQMPREMVEFNYRTGQAMGMLMKGRDPGVLGKAVSGAKSFTDKITSLNGYVDDLYRLMGYFNEMDRYTARAGRGARAEAIRDVGGFTGSKAQAQVAAEQLVRKTMYTWDNMTPFERQTMRFIFPFYGFMSHIGRFAYRYAVDHPVRLAWTAAFARNEIEDWNSGLPERLRSMILVGGEDGKSTGINLAGWNPFGDVANMLTLTGWLSQMNPIISTIAEQFGIDPRTGQANLYPESMYDPVSGRLVLQTRNPATALLENLIPQTQLLTDAAGWNDNLTSLARTDPAAAQRLRLSSFGIPNLWRGVDLPLEAMKAEGSRYNAFTQTLSQALAHPDKPTPYPVLNELRDQILRLQSESPEALRPYSPAAIADIQNNMVATLGS